MKSILSTLSAPKEKGAKRIVFPEPIAEKPSNGRDDVMPFEACEFAQYFLKKVPDLLSSKQSYEFKYDGLIKKIRETDYYDSSWETYEPDHYSLIKSRIDSEFYKLKHCYRLLAINFFVSLITLALTSKEAQQTAFGYGLVSFCLLANLRCKLNVIHNTYSILEDLNKTHFSIKYLTKKLNKKKALSAFFNKIKTLNNFKRNKFFDSYKYYLCSPKLQLCGPRLNRFEHPHVPHIDEIRFHMFYSYFNCHSNENYKLDFLDSIVNQLSAGTLKKGLFFLLKDLIPPHANKKEVENLTETLTAAIANESLEDITEFLVLSNKLNRLDTPFCWMHGA